MTATWWANTESGYMTGDYIATAIAANRAVTVVPVATAPAGTTLHQGMDAGSVPVTDGSDGCDTLSSSIATLLNAVTADKSIKHYHIGN